AVLRRQEIGDLTVRDVAELGEREAQVMAGLALLLLRLAELLQADELLADEQLAQAVRRRHLSLPWSGLGRGESTGSLSARFGATIHGPWGFSIGSSGAERAKGGAPRRRAPRSSRAICPPRSTSTRRP